VSEALAYYKKKGGSGRPLGGSLKGGKKRKAGTRLGGAKRVRKKKAGYIGEKLVNKVVNAVGTVVGVVVGGVYKAGKVAAQTAIRKAKGGATKKKFVNSGVGQVSHFTKKGGAKRVKKKAGMQLGGAKRYVTTSSTKGYGPAARKKALGGAKPKRKRRANPWLAHVKKTMKANKGMAFKAVLKKAKASYKKK